MGANGQLSPGGKGHFWQPMASSARGLVRLLICWLGLGLENPGSVAKIASAAETDVNIAAAYHRGFRASLSSTFRAVGQQRGRNDVNLTFLDGSRMDGLDGQDFVQLGSYRVQTRLGLIQSSSSETFTPRQVDGILGFGWFGGNRSASLLKTLSQRDRAGWHVKQAAGFRPMPRKFSFLANATAGELQLGGYDPAATSGVMWRFPMKGPSYGVSVYSITYGDGGGAEEILNFNSARHGGFVGQLDSGTTCVLLPNSTVELRRETTRKCLYSYSAMDHDPSCPPNVTDQFACSSLEYVAR